mmetsp:Transcript_3751/g.6398  ORF Transcript_3751/g.6398 Transcript_3751/m.6398 type:complete len:100 (+) Transcript_3751:78-377(+)
MKQVLEYFTGNMEARATALDIVLAYSSTVENRRLFESTNVCKELLRLLPEQDPDSKTRQITLKSLKCLINLSSDKGFVKDLCELNASKRIYDVLKENVK